MKLNRLIIILFLMALLSGCLEYTHEISGKVYAKKIFGDRTYCIMIEAIDGSLYTCKSLKYYYKVEVGDTLSFIYVSQNENIIDMIPLSSSVNIKIE